MKVAWPTAESVLATSSLPERTYADGLVFALGDFAGPQMDRTGPAPSRGTPFSSVILTAYSTANTSGPMLTMIWFRSTPWPARARGLVGTRGVAIGTTFGLLGMTTRIPLLECAVPPTWIVCRLATPIAPIKARPSGSKEPAQCVRFPRSTPAAIGSDVLRRGFTRDLLHESGGVSFDRFQIAVWTIVCYLHQTSIGRGWFPMSALRHGIATHRPCHRVEAGC